MHTGRHHQKFTTGISDADIDKVEELFVYCVQEGKLQMKKLYKGVNAEKQFFWEWCPCQGPLRTTEKEARKFSEKWNRHLIPVSGVREIQVNCGQLGS